MESFMDISHIREEYTKYGLRKTDMDPNPLQQFIKWFKQNLALFPHNNAATLATVNRQGIPSTRIILLKQVDEKGFVFFTNYSSNKAKDIAENPHVSLSFFWSELERQIIIKGVAEKISKEESQEYFHSRPYKSQLGAWASHQSMVISNREVLEKEYLVVEKRFKKDNVPAPDFWGGYRVKANEIEFWQGRKNRLHDRLSYKYLPQEGWILQRLSP